jgi:hypothetical protein
MHESGGSLSEGKSIPSIMLSEEKNSQFALGKQLENFKKRHSTF